MIFLMAHSLPVSFNLGSLPAIPLAFLYSNLLYFVTGTRLGVWSFDSRYSQPPPNLPTPFLRELKLKTFPLCGPHSRLLLCPAVYWSLPHQCRWRLFPHPALNSSGLRSTLNAPLTTPGSVKPSYLIPFPLNYYIWDIEMKELRAQLTSN